MKEFSSRATTGKRSEIFVIRRGSLGHKGLKTKRQVTV
jgi:hypothetical protein